MAEETKNDDPPTREAALNATDRMRTAADDDESDADTAVTLAGYDPNNEPPLSDDRVQWHVAHFEPRYAGGAFAKAGWRSY